MTDKVTEYRRRAEEVRKLAEMASNSESRKNLIALADLWTTLAAERERKAREAGKTLLGVARRLLG